MKQLKKSLTVSTVVVCSIGWFTFCNKAIDELKNTPKHESYELEDLSIANKIKKGNESIHKEYERLVEEERKRLEELERQRLERLEKIRLAKIEEAKKIEQQKKLAEQKKIEEERKKKEQQQLQVSRGQKEVTSDKYNNWMTFNISYYGNDCAGCSKVGLTASGINVKNTIYYKGYQVIASDNSVLPMGTLIEIETPYGIIKGIIADRGGMIKGYKLDVLVQSEAHASKLGRHNSKVRIIGKMNIK